MIKYYRTFKEAKKVSKQFGGCVHHHPKKRLYYVKKSVIKGWLEL